jgi:hypothetical protein
VVRKWRGFHDDEYMLGCYLRGEKNYYEKTRMNMAIY